MLAYTSSRVLVPEAVNPSSTVVVRGSREKVRACQIAPTLRNSSLKRKFLASHSKLFLKHSFQCECSESGVACGSG